MSYALAVPGTGGAAVYSVYHPAQALCVTPNEGKLLFRPFARGPAGHDEVLCSVPAAKQVCVLCALSLSLIDRAGVPYLCRQSHSLCLPPSA